jgi:predicted HTH domain antitoxin
MNLTLPPELLETAQMTETEMLREIAVMLYQQQRISLEKAAELSRISNDDFYQILINRNIKNSFCTLILGASNHITSVTQARVVIN